MEKSIHISEQEYIAAYKKDGNLDLLGVLYKPYMPLVYGLCLKYLKKKEESQDAVMQVFEKLIESVKKHEIQHFKSWLYVLTKNHCLMQLRSQKSNKEVDFDDGFVEYSYQLHHVEEYNLEENLSKMEDCIELLRNEQKRCVELFYLQKKPYQTIVALTGFELKKVKSHIQNGKRNLKKCIEESE